MVVSHKHGFIFLKTRKTAGTSIEVALSKIADDDAIVTPAHPAEPGLEPRNYEAPAGSGGLSRRDLVQLFQKAKDNHEYCQYLPYFDHTPAWLARAKLGDDVWNSYFKFCFERNPWQKLVSLFCWRYRDCEDPPPFNEWLFADRRIASDWPIYSIDGKCAVDMIGRYERLAEDLDEAIRRIGRDVGGLDLPRAKSGIRREGIRYSPQAVALVRRVFQREIELFDYECPPQLLPPS